MYMRTQINSFLSEDIIINILLWLPAKSIGRCRCVSKAWRSLLSQPHFIKAHIDVTRNTKRHQQYLLFFEFVTTVYCVTLDNAHQVFDEMSLRATKLHFSNHYCYYPQVVTCDGLVLMKSMNEFILLNPITNQVKQIPFDQNKSTSTIYGLGYDSVNSDYKIVNLTRYSEKSDSLVKVYSVKNGAWKNVENCRYHPTLAHSCTGVFINGYIHWLVSNESRNKFEILSFDLAQEKFYVGLLRISITKETKYGDINDMVLLGGCLCVFRARYFGESCVWIMNEYGNNESWTKFTFKDPDGQRSKPICMLDQEQVLVQKNWGHNVKLVRYNLKKGTYEDILVDGIHSSMISVGVTFVKSLVSPYGNYETR